VAMRKVSLSDPAAKAVRLSRGDTVIVPPTDAAKVTVAGAVAKPGVYAYTPRMLAWQALQEAGGAQKAGSLARIIVKRIEGDRCRTMFRFIEHVSKESQLPPVELSAGDLVIVAH